jgi:hypothetical protein
MVRAAKSAGHRAIQIDNGSFGGRSGDPGSVPTSVRGSMALTGTVKPLRLTPVASGSTPVKWWCKVQH